MIPEAAVEAAREASVAWSIHDLPDDDDHRAALEAAAPHMLREAWFEGFSTGMEYGEWWAGSEYPGPEPDNSNSNPYGGRA